MTEFAIGDVLSVTTGRLVSRDHMDGLYRLCEFLAGEPVFTHALPRVSNEATPYILTQHPELAGIVVPDFLDGTPDEMQAAVYGWLDGIEAEYGATRDLEPMPPEGHTSIDPISELLMMKPDVKIIAVQVLYE